MKCMFRCDRPPSSADWDYFRPLIVRLYLSETKGLREVQGILLEEYDFKASYDTPHRELDYAMALTKQST